MWGFANEVKQAEKEMKKNPRAALQRLLKKGEEVRKEFDHIKQLANQLNEIEELIGWSSGVLRDKGQSMGLKYTDGQVDAEIYHKLELIMIKMRVAHKQFQLLKKDMKRLEE
jgi:hypothetical protein